MHGGGEGARDVAGLIACQPDAIVSRVLLKSAAGTVTLFAFDAGQELSEHTSPMQALLQVIEGEAVVTIAGRVHPLTAGQVIHLPRDVPHAVRAPRAFKMLLTLLRDSP